MESKFKLPLKEHEINKTLASTIKLILHHWSKVDTVDEKEVLEIPNELCDIVAQYSYYTNISDVFPRGTRFGFDHTYTTIKSSQSNYKNINSNNWQSSSYGTYPKRITEFHSLHFCLLKSQFSPDLFTMNIKWERTESERSRSHHHTANTIGNPALTLLEYPLSGNVEMCAMNKLRLYFDYQSMKCIVKNISNEKEFETIFKLPISKKELKSKIKQEYIERAKYVFKQLNQRLTKKNDNNNDNGDSDAIVVLTNEQINEKVDKLYKQSKFFHSKYEQLCNENNIKPKLPFVGTYNWFAKFNHQENNVIIYFDNFACSKPMGKARLVGQFRD